jgi:predicted nucleotidyltransferase
MIPEKESQLIQSIFFKHRQPGQKLQIWLFGSWATQKNKKYSDIDLLIESDPCFSSLKKELIKEEFEESNSPYIFDLVFMENLESLYKQQILQERKLLIAI